MRISGIAFHAYFTCISHIDASIVDAKQGPVNASLEAFKKSRNK